MSRRVERLGVGRFDLVVIGAGATGCGVARDAALRGLSVLLLDRGDVASESSSGSSRMIHGGLRYLMRGQIALVRECLRERTILCRLAPHLVRPAPFFMPLYGPAWREGWPLRFGLAVADWLAPANALSPGGRVLDRETLVARVPGFASEELRGGLEFWDYITHDARLTLAVALGARAAGASVETYLEVLSVTGDGGGPGYSVRLRDRLTGEEGAVRCRAVVEATGALTGQLDNGAAAEAPAVAPSRGTHLAISPIVPAGTVIVAPHPADGRFVWGVGMDDHTWIGTTDVEQPDAAERCLPTRDEIAYLAEWLRVRLPSCRPEIRLARAALRPLLRGASHSRDFRCGFAGNGVLVVAGGKITTHRAMAEASVDRVVRRFFSGPAAGRLLGCTTANVPVPSAPPVPIDRWLEYGPGRQIADDETRRQLLLRHGASIDAVLALVRRERGLAHPLHDEQAYIEAEIEHAVVGELACSLSDFMWRRSELAFASDQGMAVVPVVAGRMAALLGWTREEISRQRARYEAEIERARAAVAEDLPRSAGAPLLPPAKAV